MSTGTLGSLTGAAAEPLTNAAMEDRAQRDHWGVDGAGEIKHVYAFSGMTSTVWLALFFALLLVAGPAVLRHVGCGDSRHCWLIILR
jgi:hypothetical protein